jgi:hypothetical protein
VDQLDEAAHFENIQVISCDIKPESVEKCRDVENEPISFFLFLMNEPISGKKRRTAICLIFKHRYIFWKVKTVLSRHNL